MGHYAKVEDGLVTQVIVAKAEFFDTFVDSSPGEWIKTSYNTHGGVHSEGGTPLRKNYGGIGMTYDKERDAFIPPKEHASWNLNEETCQYEAPEAYPDSPVNSEGIPEAIYAWNEETVTWEVIGVRPDLL